MPARHLEFLVEERSMEAFLRPWLKRVLPEECSFEIYSYQGKDAMLRKIGDRLRGYADWMPEEYRIVLIADCDNDDCYHLQSTLEGIVMNVGLRSRRAGQGSDWQIVTRIAIEELEAWYFGDWSAVRAAYPSVPSNVPNQTKYRNPDAITGGTWEAFERILQKHGYFKQGLAKVEAATAIGKHFDPCINSSHSFRVFRDAIIDATA